MVQTYDFYPTITQSEYIRSDSTISIIYSNMGEGKTIASIARIFYRASLLKHLLLPGQSFGVIIIRDTHQNILHSVVKSWTEEWFPRFPMPHRWRNDYGNLYIESDPPIHIELFGIDDTAALAKLQGAVGVGLIWLEECVPYTDSFRTNAGISEDTFNAALVRCARQQGIPPSLQMSFNPPDEDHWIWRRLLATPDGPLSAETPLIAKRVFKIAPGENTHLPEEARQTTKAAYQHDPAAYARFVLGDTATRYPGKRVAVNFNPDWHIAKRPLDPVEGWDGWMSFDSWGNPAVVIGQQAPNGRLVVLDAMRGGEDIRGLIRDYVFPRLHSPRWYNKCRGWRYLGDTTMQQQDQSNVASSAAQAVIEAFAYDDGTLATFEPGPSGWQMIRDGLLYGLKWTVGGEPAILIDPVHCKELIAGLKGAWHYRQNKAGVVNFAGAVKSEHSHICDAFANGVCVLSPWRNPGGWKRKQSSQAQQNSRQRAMSYATS